MQPDPSDPKQGSARQGEMPRVTHGWRSGGFALIVTGIAGLLFHWAQEVPIVTSDLGQISIGLILLGTMLILVGIVQRASHQRGRATGQ